MAKKKPTKVNATSDRHTTPRVVFHLPPELLVLIETQAKANDRTRTGEILRALKTYYGDQGLWPPADAPSED